VLEDGVGVAIALKKYLLRKCRPGNWHLNLRRYLTGEEKKRR
jgi:hypothetical protein